MAKLIRMEEALHERVVGQDEAIEAVSDAVRRARAGLQDPRRPIGSFLFLGPTGVGKTELARALAAFLFDDEHAMVRLDMSEYMERFSVQRLIGAPPGYVGYEEGGQLTEAVRRRPYQVILLDEIEKAHPDVFNVLLQVLDDGRLTDGRGRTVDFKNAVVIMTSNVGSASIAAYAGRPAVGEESYEAMKREVLGMLRGTFRPEFLNRVDEVIVFHALTDEDLAKIVDLLVAELGRRLAARDLAIDVTPAARSVIAREGTDPAYGARPLKRTIQRLVENPLARALLRGEFRPGALIRVDADPVGGTLIFAQEGATVVAEASGRRDARSATGWRRGGRHRPTTRTNVDPRPPPDDEITDQGQGQRGRAAELRRRQRAGAVAPPPQAAAMTPAEARARIAAARPPLPPPPAWLRPVHLPDGVPFERPAAPPQARLAAALVLLYPGPGNQAHLVLTERVEYGGDHHSGEVSLPGGKADPGDRDEEATALREAEEEVGLDPEAAGVEVIGRLDPLWIPPSNFLVTPIVAVAARRPAFVADPREVAAILESPVAAFLPGVAPFIVDPDPWGRPFRYGAYRVDGRIVWGATAAILGQLGALLGGPPAR